jgi:hypothetical protein
VEQLERVDLSVSENSVKLAFWINVYNSLIMHVMLDIYVLQRQDFFLCFMLFFKKKLY